MLDESMTLMSGDVYEYLAMNTIFIFSGWNQQR